MDGPQQVDYLMYRNGEPKNHLTYRILYIFFVPPFPPRKTASFTINEVAAFVLPGHEGEVEEIVQQLERDKFLIKNLSKPGYYQYNYNCPYVESQNAFEKVVAYKQMPKLPRCEIIGDTNIFL